MTDRFDETWHRLLEWTSGQTPSERLAALVLAAEGYTSIDPSHPLGGPDHGADAHCTKNGQKWVMAVYFPRGQQPLSEIRSKLTADLKSAAKDDPAGLAFVTNQELTLGVRAKLRGLGGQVHIELLHLERLATILDRPEMHSVRRQFLNIGDGDAPRIHFGGQGGQAPGAGGAGGTAFGPGAIGGHGGDGGEIVVFSVAADDLPNPIPIIVGAGGRGEDEFGPATDGSDSWFGNIRARGGKSHATRPAQKPAPESNDPGAKIVSLVPAESYYIQGNLVTLLGTGWNYTPVQSLPETLTWHIYCSVSLEHMPVDSADTLIVEVTDPGGAVVASQINDFTRAPTDEGLVPWFLFTMPFKVDVAGIWRVRARIGKNHLTEIPIQIRQGST